jgi:replication factor C large subunit
MGVWIHDYRPKTVSEVQGHNTAIELLRNLITHYKKGKKAILLYGGTGNGKTCSVYALANDLNYEVLEFNASDVRKADVMQSLVGNAIKQQSLFSRGKIILIDEVDGMSGVKDRGGIPTLLKLITNSSFPVILTANDPYEKKLNPLRKKAEVVEYKTLPYTSIVTYLKKICSKEKIDYEEEAITHIARTAAGDMRAAINDLQTIANKGKVTKKEVEDVGERKKKETIINALMRIFKTTHAEIARPAFADVDEDLDKIFLWMDENLPKEYLKEEDLEKGYDALSKADVFFGRIRRWQYYRFYVYIYDLLTAGVALAKKEKYHGFLSYRPTTRILKIWMANQKNLKKKAIAAKIAEKTHTSTKVALHSTLPYLQVMFKKNKKEGLKLAEYFDLDQEEIGWLGK